MITLIFLMMRLMVADHCVEYLVWLNIPHDEWSNTNGIPHIHTKRMCVFSFICFLLVLKRILVTLNYVLFGSQRDGPTVHTVW